MMAASIRRREVGSDARSSKIRSGPRKGNQVRSSHGTGLVRSETLAKEFIEHFCACLRALAKRDGRPRSDHAGFLLPLTEMLKVRYRTSGCSEGFARTDLRLWRGLRAAGWQQDQNESQPECYSQ
jgi:hypothetical protein